MPPFNAFALIMKAAKIGGSGIGAPADIQKMLQFASDHKVHSWIEERPMKDANQSIIDMDAGKARYRYVLVNEKNLAEVEKENK